MYQLRRFLRQTGSTYTRVDNDPESSLSGRYSSRRPLWSRLVMPVIFVVALFAVLAGLASFMGSPITPPKSKPANTGIPAPPPIPPPSPPEPPKEADKESGPPLATNPAAAALYALRSRQSATLAQASSRYTLKTGRIPPPNFDKWFSMAQKKHCLIDDYDQIQRDFEPWYQLAAQDPEHFNGMVDRGRQLMKINSMGMTIIKIQDGKVHMPTFQGTSFDGDWPRTLGRFASVLPDMEFLLNGRDEPRIVFDVRAPDAIQEAMKLKDPKPFHIAPKPTADWFKERSGCNPSSSPKGFGMDGSADIAFLRSSSSSDFTTDLWPLLSMTKLSPCFSDILFPGQYFYDESWWSGSFSHPNDVKWEDKKAKIYWRGMSNGGHIIGQNYHRFPRFRLITIARNHSDLIDAKMTQFAETHCTDNCERNKIIEEYDITGPKSSKEEVYKFKYLLDVDGNTFSGRYLSLLRSGSLVFKSTVYDEYFNDWLLPYEHYVPVSPDLSDLVDKVQWAIDNEAEARRIQETGQLFAEKVMTDDQNDCYFAMVLLEWARLQNKAKIH
ncbi:CAP10 domain-containing protein [Mycena indigotica]|uniref:CAP10 domain-containing protein n=1 Tax=Mycena indigotica TaxID=2126181 RepID=A0A8H6VYU1_9AGAR|nr:CAP10 domain-containing protein [Mycena indigotica]KAF7299174.1 CAP10 domain-containing protein [Mycena indigotica]